MAAPVAKGQPLITLRDVRKSYNIGQPNEAEVLHGLSLQVDSGEFVALIGPSGSGKSTLLNILGLLERMTEGDYRLLGDSVRGLSDAELTLRRRSTLGFVFQFHHLLPAFTALENVTLPALMHAGRVSAQADAKARELLDAVGLAAALHKRPSELSGGMQQRVGLARAMALCMTGDKLSATDAKAMGMIWEVADDAVAAAKAMAEKLAAMPTKALVATRALLRGAHTHSLDEQLDLERDVQSRLGFTHDYIEGVTAFLQKRPAQFKGE